MDKSESLTELFKALAKFQGELENVEKGKSGHGYKYATLGHCIDAAKEALSANGLSVSQLLGSNEKGESTMQTVLAHQSGEYISSICVMPIAKLAGGGSNNPAQVMGASITYMRRYQYAAIIGLAQDDTDAVVLDDTAKFWIDAINSGANNLNEITDQKYRRFIASNL